MDKKLMSEQIQRELAEYCTLTSDEEKSVFWERIRASDAQLTREDRSIVNQVIYDDLQAITATTKELLSRSKLAKTT